MLYRRRRRGGDGVGECISVSSRACPQVKAKHTFVADRMAAMVARGELPEKSRDIVWGCLVGHTMDRMVEGISRVKRCTPRGRALMRADADDCVRHARALVEGALKCVRVVPPPPEGPHTLAPWPLFRRCWWGRGNA